MSRAARESKTNIIVAAVAIVLLIPGAIWLTNRAPGQEQTQTTSESEQTKQTTQYIAYQGEDGETALELLKTNAKVVTEDSEFGEFVVSINGEDGNGQKYWIYYVNGKEASVGAGDYVTENGETIEWKLQ